MRVSNMKIFSLILVIFFLTAGFPAFAFEASSTNFELHAGVLESTSGRSTSTNFTEQNAGGQIATGIVASTMKVFSGILHWLFGPHATQYEQSSYRWFNNADSTDVGSALAAQNTAATAPAQGTAFRLRLLLHISNHHLAQSAGSFKLQFALPAGACDADFTNENWNDIASGSGLIRYYNNATPADGANLTANASDPTHSSDTIVPQTYEESNNFSNTTAAIPKSQDGKWDFALVDNSATGGTTYCFRTVKSDGSLLDTYTVIPQITTSTSGSVPASGTYESPAFDSAQSGETAGIKSGYNTLTWTENRPTATTVKFQIASNDDNTTWTYLGPDGTASTWYGCSESGFSNYCSGACSTGTSTTNICRISGAHNNNRYFKYKFTLCNETGCSGSGGFSVPKVEKTILNWSP